MANETFKPLHTANKRLFREPWFNKSRLRLRFEGSSLKQEDTTPLTPNNVLNLFVVYELDRWSRDLNTDFTPKDCLFGAVKLTKNADPDKYNYSGYGIGFDLRLEFSLSDGSNGVKVSLFLELILAHLCILIIKKKGIFIPGEGPTQGLHDTTLTAEIQYSINFSRPNRKLCLSVHYNGQNSFLFVNAKKIYQFKANDSETKKYSLCLGNIFKDFTANNMKKQD